MEVQTEYAKKCFDEEEDCYFVRHVYRKDTDNRRHTAFYFVNSSGADDLVATLNQNAES